MLSKLKSTVTNIMETDKLSEPEKKKIDVSVLNGEEIKVYKKILEKFKENIETIEELGQTNKDDIVQYIK